MSRIASALAAGAAQRRPLVVPFLTAGYPSPEASVELLAALAEGGADMIEIGMPFSDPIADGPTIQRSSQQALANGMRVEGVLETVVKLRSLPSARDLPILLMGYCNPVFRFGLRDFLNAAQEVGVDGLIVPDLPPDEADEYLEGSRRAGLSTVFLMAPNTPDARIERVDSLSTDFSYCVSVTGVTGARGQVQAGTVAFLQRVRARAAKPFVVGFGIQRPEHVHALGPYADGVVVGSALIDTVDAARDPATELRDHVRRLRAAAEQTTLHSPPPHRVNDGLSGGA